MPEFKCGTDFGCSRICRLRTVLCIIAALFFLALGFILGAVLTFAATILPGVIVTAVILAILYIIFLILRLGNS